eukprot:Hpha_TRINITY_DN26593_c0_g1::TRINITY_DN26593_c0_g1_i1::g.112926::m.112926
MEKGKGRRTSVAKGRRTSGPKKTKRRPSQPARRRSVSAAPSQESRTTPKNPFPIATPVDAPCPWDQASPSLLGGRDGSGFAPDFDVDVAAVLPQAALSLPLSSMSREHTRPVRTVLPRVFPEGEREFSSPDDPPVLRGTPSRGPYEGPPRVRDWWDTLFAGEETEPDLVRFDHGFEFVARAAWVHIVQRWVLPAAGIGAAVVLAVAATQCIPPVEWEEWREGLAAVAVSRLPKLGSQSLAALHTSCPPRRDEVVASARRASSVHPPRSRPPASKPLPIRCAPISSWGSGKKWESLSQAKALRSATDGVAHSLSRLFFGKVRKVLRDLRQQQLEPLHAERKDNRYSRRLRVRRARELTSAWDTAQNEDAAMARLLARYRRAAGLEEDSHRQLQKVCGSPEHIRDVEQHEAWLRSSVRSHENSEWRVIEVERRRLGVGVDEILGRLRKFRERERGVCRREKEQK